MIKKCLKEKNNGWIDENNVFLSSKEALLQLISDKNSNGQCIVSNIAKLWTDFLHIAQTLNINIYGLYQNTRIKPWIFHLTFGRESPKTKYIKLSNNLYIIDWKNFGDIINPSIDDMINIMQFIPYGCVTPSKYIQNQLRNSVLDWINDSQNKVATPFIKSCLAQALRGGGLSRDVTDKVINIEYHYDIHQMYAWLLKIKKFPYGKAYLENGYIPGDCNFYSFSKGYARLKKNGFALLTRSTMYDFSGGLFGITKEPLENLGWVTNADLSVLADNYDLYWDEDGGISQTIVFSTSLPGTTFAGKLIDDLYKHRIEAKTTGNVIEASFYKKCNEVVAGTFERTAYYNDYWRDMSGPYHKNRKMSCLKNCAIGAFLTAYGREYLNQLLHNCKFQDIVGWDTDCVFTDKKIDYLENLIGTDMGKLHYDCILLNCHHYATKRYAGFDLISNRMKVVAAGVTILEIDNFNPKARYYSFSKQLWDKETQSFISQNFTWDIKEAKKCKKKQNSLIQAWSL